jgi:hypothetical protein
VLTRRRDLSYSTPQLGEWWPSHRCTCLTLSRRSSLVEECASFPNATHEDQVARCRRRSSDVRGLENRCTSREVQTGRSSHRITGGDGDVVHLRNGGRMPFTRYALTTLAAAVVLALIAYLLGQ